MTFLNLESWRHGRQHSRPVARPVAGHRSLDLDFGSIFRTKSRSVAKGRSRTLTVAILVYGVFIAAIALLPLLSADTLPVPKAVRTFLVAPVLAAPPPPPPPAPAAPVAKAKPKPRPAKPVKPEEPDRLVAAIEVPDEIPVEEGIDLGAEGDVGIEDGAAGVPGGLPGGVEGGVPGGVVGGIVGGIPQPPPPPSPAPVLRVGGQITEPDIVHDVRPKYPELARAVGRAAIVITELRVDVRGYVKSVKVLRGDPLFDAAAIEALEQRRYRPLLLNGQPQEFIITVVVQFNLLKA